MITFPVEVEWDDDLNIARDANGKKIINSIPVGNQNFTESVDVPIGSATAMQCSMNSGVFVIDFDTLDNPMMSELQMIAPTHTVSTKKGFHLYYKAVESITQSSLGKVKDVDIRANGNWVFAPPTIGYDVQGECDIQDFTVQHNEVYRKYITAPAQAGEKLPVIITSDSIEAIAQRYQRAKSGEMAGGRDTYLLKIANSLATYFPSDEEKRQAILFEIGFNIFADPLDDAAIRRVIGQSKSFIETNPPIRKQKPSVDIAKFKLVSMDEVKDNLDDEERFTTGFEDFDNALREEEHEGTDKQGGIALGELLVITGQSGNGKTLVATQMTRAMQRQGVKSLWFSYEVKLKKLKRIFTRLKADVSMILSIQPDKNEVLIGSLDWLEAYIQQAIEQGITLVAIDNLDFIEKRQDENINFSANQQAYLSVIVTDLARMAVKYNIMILLIAHVRKVREGKDRPTLIDIAGTSTVERLCSVGIVINRKDPTSTHSELYLDKNRVSGKKEKIDLEYRGGRLIKYNEVVAPEETVEDVIEDIKF